MYKRQVLGARAPVSVEADFFEIGGNSLMAGRLVATLRKRLDASLPLAAVFSCRTVAAMALKVDEQLQARRRGAAASRTSCWTTGKPSRRGRPTTTP